jgi:hypothetical protein
MDCDEMRETAREVLKIENERGWTNAGEAISEVDLALGTCQTPVLAGYLEQKWPGSLSNA